MGQSVVDITLRDEALQKFPFSIECKSTESINLRDFIQQAKSNQKEGTDWMVVACSFNHPSGNGNTGCGLGWELGRPRIPKRVPTASLSTV